MERERHYNGKKYFTIEIKKGTLCQTNLFKCELNAICRSTRQYGKRLLTYSIYEIEHFIFL